MDAAQMTLPLGLDDPPAFHEPFCSALFVRRDSIYKRIPGVDAFDADRDARRVSKGPLIAHPPCRSWGPLRGCARPRPGERRLAIWAVMMVRRLGGVLEHPRGSLLWRRMGMPLPGERSDQWGGYTVEVNQFDFGHRASKPTWLYIVGNSLWWASPMRRGEPTHCISQGNGVRIGHPKFKPRVPQHEREATPLDFAMELIQCARRCRPNTQEVAGEALPPSDGSATRISE